MTRTMTGGCQCGRIRYTAAIEDDAAYLCHCGYCRRATGGVSIAFKSVRRDAVIWDGEPDWYQSSPIGKRPFCSACGTPLGYQFVEGGEHMDLTVGSFDEPGYFRPTSNCSVETMLDAWVDVRALPGVRLDENPSTRDRWIAATGAIPE